MNEWRFEMRREMEQLQQVIDGLGESIGVRLTALRTDMAREFDEQKRLSEEQIRFNQEQIRFNQEQERRYQAQEARYEEHHRSVSRMSASFDQSLTEMHSDLTRHIRTGSILWSTLTERTAEMQLDIERIEAETDTLRRRVDAIEKRIAG